MTRALVLSLLAACGASESERPLAPPVLTDTNPDADIVEVQLVASYATQEYLPGKPADVMAFRDGALPDSVGSVPGPLLEARLGDKVIVHFRNELDEETTIHWHGLRVPNAADGTPLSQVPVPAGGTFDYELTLVDAGLYWYHPHMRGDEQVEAGLYAPIVVHDDVAIDVAADRVFVLDDVKLESSGKLSSNIANLDLMLGRMGNVVLINGRKHPSMPAAAGSRERGRFVNSANGRYFNLELPGRTFKVIGWDGGLIETPYDTAMLLVAPGERYEVLVELGGGAGETLELRTLHYDRGHDIPDPGPIDLLAIELGAPVAAAAPLPASFGVIDAIPFDGNTPRRRFVLEEDDADPSKPVFTINGEAFPDITPVRGPTGTIEVWEIDNQAEMDHPFHLHGMSFQQVGAAPGWKDTINVKQKSVVQLAVRYGAPGRWMYHCHILEHAERGMMGELEVAP